MWCKHCNIETNETLCPVCGNTTVEDLPTKIYWCGHCRTPVLQYVNQANEGYCSICKRKAKYLSADIRPVFPEERLLIECLLEKEPNQWVQASVWASGSRYYVDGKPIPIPRSLFATADANSLQQQIKQYPQKENYKYFDANISNFVEANKVRLNELIEEAHRFIKGAAERFPQENIVLSFSGGKDSTVTADLAIKALSDPSLVHIFGNTTLEFPFTTEYAKRYIDSHPLAIFEIAKNDEQDFYDVCEDIGPPARMMRWCCSMFKTGPISRVINSMYRNQQILTFYGIRKSESVSRSKYNRIEENTESVKIQQQTVASPIFFWMDADIWLYLLAEDIDFNEAYRLGYDRV